MVKFFVYDNKSNALTLNEPEILLVKEFKDLWDVDRNKCDEDPTGKKRLKAYRELTYITFTKIFSHSPVYGRRADKILTRYM